MLTHPISLLRTSDYTSITCGYFRFQRQSWSSLSQAQFRFRRCLCLPKSTFSNIHCLSCHEKQQSMRRCSASSQINLTVCFLSIASFKVVGIGFTSFRQTVRWQSWLYYEVVTWEVWFVWKKRHRVGMGLLHEWRGKTVTMYKGCSSPPVLLPQKPAKNHLCSIPCPYAHPKTE